MESGYLGDKVVKVIKVKVIKVIKVKVIKVFQYLKSPLRFAMKIAFAKKGGLWGKIHVL